VKIQSQWVETPGKQTNCLMKHVILGKIEERRKLGRRRKQLLDEFKEKRRYWELKDEIVDHTLWGTCFGRGYGTVARGMDG
jgi:hypothetical protein